jgi:hypothetical protein
MYCLCVNVYCHRESIQLQLTNISINSTLLYNLLIMLHVSHLIGFIMLIIFFAKVILRSVLLCNFFHPLPISSLLVSNILFSALFSNIPNQNLFISVLTLIQTPLQRNLKTEYTLARSGYLLPFLAFLLLTSSTCLTWKCAGKKVYDVRTVTSRSHIFTTHIHCIIPEESARYTLTLFVH